MTASARPTQVTAAVSRLKAEIALNRDFTGLNEAAFLSLVWTWQRIDAMGRLIFPRFGITDAQFNVLMILWDYRGRTLRQHELADILVVNRPSMGGVLERMERGGWIVRATDPEDRRAQHVALSDAGIAKLNEVRGPYYRMLNQIFLDSDSGELPTLILFFDTVRARIAAIEGKEKKRLTRKASANGK